MSPEVDRYEPLPTFAELPRWVWRKLGRGGRLAVLAVLLIAAGLAAVLVPASRDESADRAAAEQRSRAEGQEARVAALRREQAPRRGRTIRVARPAMLADLTTAIAADARRRYPGDEIDRAECEPFPRTVGGTPPERDPARPTGRYACVAVTSEFGRDAPTTSGVIGHPYRAVLDFQARTFTYCKVTGVAGPSRDQPVTVPRACGGR